MSASPSRALPCVVQVGFAGSRRLFDLPAGGGDQQRALEQQVEERLGQTLASLPKDLGLAGHHFLCGISQIAAGADLIFTRACERLQIPQRIFLPQPRDVYLEAVGSSGHPDFAPQARLDAEQILTHKHIIQERVVSDADDRATRFEDCNREILRESNVVVCLIGAGTENGRGGTAELLTLAQERGKTVLEIRVVITKGQAELLPTWHGLKSFRPPVLPQAVEGVTLQLDSQQSADAGVLPSVSQFCGAVKQHASAEAKRHNELFSRAALVVVGTHVLATLCATVVLAAHGAREAEAAPDRQTGFWILGLLALEFALLACGFMMHRWLHHAKSQKSWAISRLLAEINRSVTALGNLHIHLAYLFGLRLPRELSPLFHTINILHLRSTRPFAHEPWEALRDAYLVNRFDDSDPRKGQIRYFTDRCKTESNRLRFANALFITCSSLAILATATKLVLQLLLLRGRLPAQPEAFWPKVLGTLAVFLPTLAVGALSWAAAKEYKARLQAFDAMRRFLQTQEDYLKKAVSSREFHLLVEETESNLLGETVEWYFRRTVIGVP